MGGTKYVMRTDILFDDFNEESNSDSEDGTVDEKGMILSVLCEKISIPPKITAILDEMDLSQMSCRSFLSPGVTLLKRMLIDAGVDEGNALFLIDEAVKVA